MKRWKTVHHPTWPIWLSVTAQPLKSFPAFHSLTAPSPRGGPLAMGAWRIKMVAWLPEPKKSRSLCGRWQECRVGVPSAWLSTVVVQGLTTSSSMRMLHRPSLCGALPDPSLRIFVSHPPLFSQVSDLYRVLRVCPANSLTTFRNVITNKSL
jgi:hypothetical protein